MNPILHRLSQVSLACALTAAVHCIEAADATLIENNAPDWIYSSPDFVRLDALDASGGNINVGWRAGDSAQYTFTGNRVQLFGAKFPQGKTAQIFIDDLDNALATGDWVYPSRLPRQLIWTSDLLADGEHTLKRVTDGDWIEIDFIRILTAPDPVPTAPTNLVAMRDPRLEGNHVAWRRGLRGPRQHIPRRELLVQHRLQRHRLQISRTGGRLAPQPFPQSFRLLRRQVAIPERRHQFRQLPVRE
jgi:hypothetical protein